MNTVRCPECNMVNWATAISCKRCAYFFQTAETSVNAFETSAIPETVAVQAAAPVQNTFVEQPPAATHHAPRFNKPAFEAPPNWMDNKQFNGNFGQNQQQYNQQNQQQYNQNFNQSYGQAYQQPNYGQANFPPNFPPANQKIGLAVTSMILGILSIVTTIFVVGILFAPVGLILGIVALVKIKNKPQQYGGKGFAIAGVITSALITLFLPVIAAIAIPNILAATRAANEGSAISVIHNLADAEADYRRGAGKGVCADMKTLAASNAVEPDFALKSEKNGYRFLIVNYPLGGCEITATPLSASSGSRSFYYSTDDNQIRAGRKNGKPADKQDNLLKDDYKEEEIKERSANVIPNESGALASIRNISGAQSTYISTYGQGECCGDLQTLADLGLIRKDLADGEDGGYIFKVSKVQSRDGYEVTATPISNAYNSRSFFKSPLEGLRGAAKNGQPATRFDPPVDY